MAILGLGIAYFWTNPHNHSQADEADSDMVGATLGITREDWMIHPSSQAVFKTVPRGWVAELPAISSRFLFSFYIAIFIPSGYDCYSSPWLSHAPLK